MNVAAQHATFTASRNPGTREVRTSKSEGRRAPGAPLPDLSGYANVLSKRDLAEVLGCSVRTIELQLADGTFPIPRLARLGKPGWSKARVEQFFTLETFAPMSATE